MNRNLQKHRVNNQLPSGRGLMKTEKNDIIIINTPHTH